MVWGLINFIFVFSDSYRRPLKNAKLDAVLGFLLTFLITLLTKVLFNSESMSQALQYFASMFHLNGNALADAYGNFFLSEYRGYLILGLLLLFPVIEKLRARFLAKDLAAGTAGGRTIVWESLQFIVVMALLIAGMQKFLSQKLEAHKVPRFYELTDKIRRTYNGKLDRKAYRCQTLL